MKTKFLKLFNVIFAFLLVFVLVSCGTKTTEEVVNTTTKGVATTKTPATTKARTTKKPATNSNGETVLTSSKTNNGTVVTTAPYIPVITTKAGAADRMAKLNYPSFEETPGDKNSWEYMGDEEYTLKWYVDVANWHSPTGKDEVSKKIKEITGITIEFDTPVSDDGQKLATMIAGGDLPDIITTPTSQSKIISSLAQQGYVYDINTLANKWAKTLYNHLPYDVLDWWSYGNGKTYGIPNHYYSYEDVPEGQLQPNGGMMVRKDIFDAWQSYVETNLKESDGFVSYQALDGSTKRVEWEGYITTPEGFKASCLWALNNYKGTSAGKITTGLLLSQFSSSGCTSLTWLSQFFAIPYEDANGNYVYTFTQESYRDMLLYLNDLYLAGIITAGNFTQDYDGIGGVVASGQAFATLVTPQDYQMHYVTAKESGYEYITMYITNENGDAPILSDIRGYGYLMNMITTKCKRPDLVIKLFDFLTSDEGQLLIGYGIEGVTWNYTDETKTAIYHTDTYLDEKSRGVATKYGLLQFDLLINWQFYDNMMPRTNHGKTEQELFRTNLKRPLTIYSYDMNASHFVVDATDERFNKYNQTLTRIDNLIGKQLPKIIKAKNRNEAINAYNKTVETMKSYGLDLIITMNSEAYEVAKQKLHLTYGYPGHQDGYVNSVDRKHPNGDLSLYRNY